MKEKKQSIHKRLIALLLFCIIPLTLLFLYVLATMNRFSNRYDERVKNIASVNQYNISFKEDLDYAMYIIAINTSRAEELVDTNLPKTLIASARETFQKIQKKTDDKESRQIIVGILRNLDTLEGHVDDITRDAKIVGMYDKNMNRLDMDIRVLTELIQEEIQAYISVEVDYLEALHVNLRSHSQKVTIICIILLIMTLIVATVRSRAIMSRLMAQLNQLRKLTKKAGQGDFTVHADLSKGDIELAELGEGFNQMVEQLGTLMENIQNDQINLRRAEQKLLQAQINPHFLYNTLDAIIWLAESGENEQVTMMVSALSDFFRTTLSKGRDYITVQEEEAHIESYLKIQQFRYQDILQYEIFIDEELYPNRILKLMLQPLVENALYHGIKNKRGMGMIRVRGWKEGNEMCFTVEDNGIGMTEERLDAVVKKMNHEADSLELKKENEKDGFGLYNVMQRIRLYYGTQYGIRIESTYGEGTKMSFRLPIIREDEEKVL